MNYINQADIPPGMLLRIIEAKQNLIAEYEQLLKMTTDQEDIRLIRLIWQDDITQFNNFVRLYRDLFNDQPLLAGPAIPQITSYISGIKSAIVDVLNNFFYYNNIFFTDTNEEVRNVFARALNDSNRHSTTLVYIYTKLLEDKLK